MNRLERVMQAGALTALPLFALGAESEHPQDLSYENEIETSNHTAFLVKNNELLDVNEYEKRALQAGIALVAGGMIIGMGVNRSISTQVGNDMEKRWSKVGLYLSSSGIVLTAGTVISIIDNTL